MSDHPGAEAQNAKVVLGIGDDCRRELNLRSMLERSELVPDGALRRECGRLRIGKEKSFIRCTDAAIEKRKLARRAREIVALGPDNKPSFNLLQNYGSSKAPLIYYVFDVMTAAGVDVMTETLQSRRRLLAGTILSGLADPIRLSPELDGSLADLIASVKSQGFEGPVAKRRDSKYEVDLRSGAWMKMRVNAGQEFVIAGYTPSAKSSTP